MLASSLENGSTEEIPVIKARPLRKGPPVVVGVIKAEVLIDRYYTPRRNARTKKGYQREPSLARVSRLKEDLRRRRVDLPTAVLLSMRDGSEVSLRQTEKGLFLSLDSKRLYVVDGQHRIESLRALIDENPTEWSDFLIPFVCVIGASEFEEMEQFYVVNSTAKSVRTDLAYDLLKQRAENDPDVIPALQERGEKWKVDGQKIVERLELESNLWRGRIRLPGEPKARTTINSSGMVNSLKQILSSPYFDALTGDNQVKILEAYWLGVGKVLPDCFDEPTKYTIQKTTGVITLHTFLLSVIEHVRAAGNSVIERDSYMKVLDRPLTELQGDNREGSPVQGSDFWLAGLHGAAGSFSSNAGRRVLLAKLQHRLPPIEVE